MSRHLQGTLMLPSTSWLKRYSFKLMLLISTDQQFLPHAWKELSDSESRWSEP